MRTHYYLITICLRNVIDYDSWAFFVTDKLCHFPQLSIREEKRRFCEKILLSCHLYENSIAINLDLQI